jgi:hypothetical protein
VSIKKKIVQDDLLKKDIEQLLGKNEMLIDEETHYPMLARWKMLNEEKFVVI